jgi:hypothetical protein
MAITVHLEVKGEPLSMLLDFIEVVQSHTGMALATQFVRILREFGIEHKVSIIVIETSIYSPHLSS